MNRRYAIVGIVILLAAATTGMLAVYAPTDATASSPATPTELEGSYTVTETVLVDGDRFFERESIVDAETGAQRSVLSFEDSSYDSYWTGDGERYTKVAFESEARLEEWLADSDDEVVRTVDDEHGAILAASANVTAERVDAGTWGEYLLERGESYSTTFEYDVAESTENVRPEWLDDASSE